MRHRKTLLLLLASVILTAAVFGPAVHYGFIDFDDDKYITGNPHVLAGLSRAGLIWAFTTGYEGNWHPLTWLSHMADVRLFGQRAGGHHLVSLIVHEANAILLFVALRGMTGALWKSALLAALFLVHPLHVESVVWVAERKDLLYGFFWFAAMAAYLSYVRRPGPGRYATVLLLFVLGLMAKPMIVTLPFVLLLLDYWPLGRLGPGCKGATSPCRRGLLCAPLLEKAPLLVLSAASGIVTYYVQAHGGAVRSLQNLALTSRLQNALVAYVTYLGKTFWPSRLALIYPLPAEGGSWLPAAAAGALLLLLLVLGGRALRRLPYLGIGWFWYLGTLVPVIGLVQVGAQSLADRYTYLPLVGLWLAIIWGVEEATRARRVLRPLALGLQLVALAAAAVAAREHVGYWRDSFTVFSHAAEVTSGNWVAHNNLGVNLAQRGRTGEAIPHFMEAVRSNPGYAEGHSNLGAALLEQGRLEDARSALSAALRLRQDYPEALNNLGFVLLRQGRAREAMPYLAQAARLNPFSAVTHYNLGLGSLALGRFGEAAAHFRETLRLRPDHAPAREKLAAAERARRNSGREELIGPP